MVRLTRIACSRSVRHLQKKIFQRRGEYIVKSKNVSVRRILEERNINIITADELLGISETPKVWDKPEDLLPDFRVAKPAETDRSVPHGEPVKNFVLSNRIKFTYGINQACILTNTQSLTGLPPLVEQLKDQYSIKNQKLVVQKAVMQSQIWNSTRDILPTYRPRENIKWKYRKEFGIPDKKSAQILLDNFLLACGPVTKDFPNALKRRMVYKPEINTVFQYKGKNIHVNSIDTCMILSDRGLPLFADSSVIKETMDYTLPSMDPVHPTIDLMPVNTLNFDGTENGALTKPILYPQTVFRINNWAYCHPNTNQAYNLVNTYAIALAEARQRFEQTSGELPYPICMQNVNVTYNTINFTYFQLNTLDTQTSGELPYPICIQNVNVTYNRINFIYFQLNTLDTVNETGVKNTAWFSSQRLFEKHRCKPWDHPTNKYGPHTYGNFNPNVFKLFLATYLYGIA